jgi:hydrogenase-4 component B
MARHIVHVFACGAALAVLAAAIWGLQGGSLEIAIPGILAAAGGLALGMDRISAFFLLIVAAVAIPSSLYAIGYVPHYGRRQVWIGLASGAFLLAKVFVVLARNAVTFLFFWELMSLASTFLVLTETDNREARDAAWLYAVMTHAGTACLLIGFLVISRAANSLSMHDWPVAAAALDPGSRNAVFLLLAAGFLSKAGAIPFHIWLPRAHPAAPSHVSAMMSGVMIKLGVYGLIRVGFDWLGAGPRWWGMTILIIGALSAVLGVLYAIVDSDLKRLLAWSSVENIGVILIGLGAALVFHSYRLDALSALALVAALLHSLNHALFKSLLFLGAGSVLQAAGTRNLEQMGGLLRRMPQTGVLFLIGTLAISAMPPLNGFVSEWLTFQALLLSFRVPEQFFNIVFALAIAALALTAGLAAACFVRAFGIAFLALPRADRAAQAGEVHWTMRAAMALAALTAVTLGVAPSIVLGRLSVTAAELVHERPDLSFDSAGISVGSLFASVSPAGIAVVLAVLMLAVWFGLRSAGANLNSRLHETWACGRAKPSASFNYTAAAFANPFKRVFAFLYRVVAVTETEPPEASRFYLKAISYRTESRSIIEESIYAPIGNAVRRTAARARQVQSGNVHAYLLYIFLALIALLVAARGGS